MKSSGPNTIRVFSGTISHRNFRFPEIFDELGLGAVEDLNPLSERNPKKSRRSGNPCLEIKTQRIMPHETLKVRLLEFMGTELDNLYVEREYVERNYVERKEFFSDYCISYVDSCW